MSSYIHTTTRKHSERVQTSAKTDHASAVIQYWKFLMVAVWLSGNTLALMNVVALRRARLVLGWVTVRGYTILIFNQATQVYSAWPSLRR